MTNQTALTEQAKNPNFWFPLACTGATIAPVLFLIGWLNSPFASPAGNYSGGPDNLLGGFVFIFVFCAAGLAGLLIAFGLERIKIIAGWQKVLIWPVAMILLWCLSCRCFVHP